MSLASPGFEAFTVTSAKKKRNKFPKFDKYRGCNVSNYPNPMADIADGCGGK